VKVRQNDVSNECENQENVGDGAADGVEDATDARLEMITENFCYHLGPMLSIFTDIIL
jgi:hypothetical protein